MGRTRVVMALVAVVTALAAVPAHADPRDDKRRIDAEVTKAGAVLEGATGRAQEAARQYAAANEALPGAELRVAEGRGRVIAATAEVRAAERAVAAAQKEVDAANVAVIAAQARVTQARDALGGFVSAAYKGSGVVTLNMLVDARSPTDLANRLGYLDFVVERQREAIDDLVETRLVAREASNTAILAQRRAEGARLAAKRVLAEANTERVAAETAATELTRLTGQRQQALQIAEEERAASLARYEELKAESARVETELREWEARQRNAGAAPGPVLQPGARLLMPVQGWKSSDFGMRYDPFYHVWQLHAGVDIAAGGGQPIYAAADGQVTRAGWNDGYGNYTCIHHGTHQGTNLATCYAHQSQILVVAGQWVRRGQLIGRVGTTGASTGYHLHFEVRLAGRPVDPLGWLPACLC